MEFLKRLLTPTRVQLCSEIVAIGAVGVAALAGWLGNEQTAIVFGGVGFVAICLSIFNRCPQCGLPLYKRRDWPNGRPDAANGATNCPNCGRNLSRSYFSRLKE